MGIKVQFPGMLAHIDERSWDPFKAEDGSMRPAGSKTVAFVSAQGTLYQVKVDELVVEQVRAIAPGTQVVVTGELVQYRKGDWGFREVTLAKAAAAKTAA